MTDHAAGGAQGCANGLRRDGGVSSPGRAGAWDPDDEADVALSPSDEMRLKAELQAATVLLSALVERDADDNELRDVLNNAVVRETAHMLERGARTDSIRAFEDAARGWVVRSRAISRGDVSSLPQRAGPARRPSTERVSPKEVVEAH